MIQCEAIKAAERLLTINIQQVMGAGKNIFYKLDQIRNMKRLNPYMILCRMRFYLDIIIPIS